jgi:hypothetical protein
MFGSSFRRRCVNDQRRRAPTHEETSMASRFLLLIVLGIAVANGAMAASPDYMMEDCKNSSQIFFQDY